MPRNGISGVYQLPTGINPVIDGTVIDAPWANTTLTDVGTAITESLPRDGQAPMTGTLKLADGTVGAPGIAWNSDSTTGLFRPQTNTIAFTAGGIEQARLTGGNLLLGTTSNNGNKLQVVGTSHFNGGVTIATGGLNVTGNIDSTGSVAAAGASGFVSTAAVPNGRSPIWRFGNSDTVGMSFFSGTAGYNGTYDTIGIHLGTAATAAGSLWQFIAGGSFVAAGHVSAGSFATSGLSYHNGNARSIYGENGNGGSLYIGGAGSAGLTRAPTLASVATTEGTLFLDAGTNKSTYINYHSGTGGTQFCNGASGVVASVSAAGQITATSFNAPNYYGTSFNGALNGTATKASTLASGGTSGGNPLAFHSVDTPGTPSWLWGSNGGTDSRLYQSGGLRVGVATNADVAQYALTIANNNSNDGGTYNIAWFSGNTLYTTAPISLTPALGRINASYLNGKLSDAALGANAWTGVQEFTSNFNVNDGSYPQLQAISTNGAGACMAFHRKGGYAVNFGLDPDNVIRLGGWSALGNRLQLDMGGNLTMAGNVAAYSDIRKKKDIEVIEDALFKVNSIRGVTFTRMEDDVRGTGVIAQELQEVLPEAVMEDNDGMLSVAYGNTIGLLIEAIKELSAKVDAQAAKIARLEDATL